ncbi:putative Ig domain-containing protein [Luteolibacter sp. SL250]|uniref:putative Ig domain-containing protein n=1 Tax=Luteolibacter sp. SL250 TaxID=2995170 RepID=UPI002271D2BF|nr:putative Ig domain-containing protein [Luteolibacter sp. SL250]WAC18236.1 putative Ig domain-containing protein [Luteolibacter sp. SL250]
MKTHRMISAVVSLLATTGVAEAQTPPNYVVSSSFMPALATETYQIHDFNDSGIVAGTWVRYTAQSSGVEEARGIFVFKDGVMRKITPAQGGVTATLSPAEGNSTGIVRISNVEGGTFYLAAPARQSILAWGGGSRNIHRIVRYKVDADLETLAQPVISASTLGGYVFADYNGETGRNEEFSAGVTDISDDGTVLGYTSDWPFFYAPPVMWKGTATANSGRWFDLDFARTLGSPQALDRDGYLIGGVADLNPPELMFYYDAPVSSATFSSASQTRIPALAGIYQPTPDYPYAQALGGPPLAHGPYRAMSNYVDGTHHATVVWANRFNELRTVSGFRFLQSGPYLPASRVTMSRNGHLLGLDEDGVLALARRSSTVADYGITRVRDEMAPSYKLYAPFDASDAGYDHEGYQPSAISINSNLDLLCSYHDQRGVGFFVLRNQPNTGRIRVEVPPYGQGSEALGYVEFKVRRTLGTTGAASVRATLAAGGTAVEGQDFKAGVTTVVSWAAGEAGEKTVRLPVLNDYAQDPAKTVKVLLGNFTGAVADGTTEVMLAIDDDDYVPTVPMLFGETQAEGTVGQDIFFAVSKSSGVLEVSGLPAGLTLDLVTGLVMGKPKVPGTFNVIFTARNNTGAGDPLAVTFTISPAAVDAPLFITSVERVTATVGQPFTYQATGTGAGITWETYWAGQTGFPGGVSFDAATGQFSGAFQAGQVGTVELGIIARRGGEQDFILLSVEVRPASGTFTATQRWLVDNGRPYEGAAGGHLEDPDGNGYGNLLEFAFGLTPGQKPLPKVPSSPLYDGSPEPGVPVSFFDSSTSPRIEVAVYRSKEAVARGISYVVEFSSNLSQWDAGLDYTVANTGPAGDIITVSDPNPGPLVGDKRFYRVKVIQP